MSDKRECWLTEDPLIETVLHITDIGKYSFVNRTFKNWNQLPAETLRTFPCKHKIFRNRVRKAISKRGEMKGIEVWRKKSSKSAVK